jgi:tRNA(Arg) A34 adenosine deaminase TadA
MSQHEQHLREAVRLAQENRSQGGRPFGAVLTLGNRVLGSGVNDIVRTHDVSAHAEMEALRTACTTLATPLLKGSVMYASGHPCPMCLAAMVLAGVSEVYYAFGNEEAAPYGYSSAPVYEALNLRLPVSLSLKKLDLGIAPAAVYASSD